MTVNQQVIDGFNETTKNGDDRFTSSSTTAVSASLLRCHVDKRHAAVARGAATS